MRNTKIKFKKDIVEQSKRSPKVFWSHARSKLNTKSGISPLLEDTKIKSTMRVTDIEKANILQKQFASVFTKEPAGDAPNITPKLVKKTIKGLNSDKAPGLDELHPKLLKELVDNILTPLTIVF